MPKKDDDPDETQPIRPPVRRKTPVHGVAVPEAWDDTPGTGSHRKITPSDAEELVQIQTKAQQLAAKASRDYDRELQFAVWFGAPGVDGKLQAMERTVTSHSKDLEELGHFKTRILTLIGVGSLAGGVAITLILEGVKYLMGR